MVFKRRARLDVKKIVCSGRVMDNWNSMAKA